MNEKLYHETFKHLTTLGSAATLLLSTFILKGGPASGAFLSAIILFFISNLASVWMMFVISGNAANGVVTHRSMRAFGVICTMVPFLMALFVLTVYLPYMVRS
jgi:hypothetical protein